MNPELPINFRALPIRVKDLLLSEVGTSKVVLVTYLIEGMEVSLPLLLMYNPGFFQQVIVDVATYWITFKIKIYIHVLSKPGGIVVTVSFSIPE